MTVTIFINWVNNTVVTSTKYSEGKIAFFFKHQIKRDFKMAEHELQHVQCYALQIVHPFSLLIRYNHIVPLIKERKENYPTEIGVCSITSGITVN